MRFFRPSLRVAITVPLALILTTTVVLQAATQHTHTQQLIDATSARILDALTAAASHRLTAFLDAPFQAQAQVADAIHRHTLYTPGNLIPVSTYLRGVYQDLYRDPTQLSVLSFGSSAGEYVGLRREADGSGFSLMLKDPSTQGELRIYQGPQPGAVRAVYSGYDPRVRPWYAPIAKTNRAGWSAIYTNYDERAEITISASTPVHHGDTLLGVVEADVKLDGLNQFLHDEPLRSNGTIAITDMEGRLVAQSDPSPVVSDGSGTTPRGERLRLQDSANPVLRAAAHPVAQAEASTAHSADFHLRVDRQRYTGRVAPYADPRGLQWRIVTLLPESDLLGDIRDASQRTLGWIVGLSALGLLACLGVIGKVTRPIQRTAEAANRLAQGQWNTRLAHGSSVQETAVLVRAFNGMAERLQRSFSDLHEQLVFDSLTHLLTRNGLLEQSRWTEPRAAALCLVGLDGFRAINDNVGHATGDRLLQAVATRIRAQLPASVVMARVGGDEFALLQLDTPCPASDIAARVQTLFAAPFASGDDEVLVTASMGLVQGLLVADALPEWLRNASVALGEAKRRGHGTCAVFAANMLEQSQEHARLVLALRQALEKQQFLVYYQPVVQLASGRVSGAEALVRWQDPARGLVTPGVFIPVAEDSGLILPLGDWVLHTATQDIARLLPQLPPDFELHVNVSARQLIQSDFAATLQDALQRSGLPAHHLTLELTESVLLGQDGLTEERLRAIRSQGVKIAIDDFGTGYSSLAYLGHLPFDCLKIDQSFVRNLCDSPQDAAIVAAVLHMAKGFGVSVVAEGVETEAQAQRLRAMGCQYAQGYWFGRPVPLAAFQSTLVKI